MIRTIQMQDMPRLQTSQNAIDFLAMPSAADSMVYEENGQICGVLPAMRVLFADTIGLYLGEYISLTNDAPSMRKAVITELLLIAQTKGYAFVITENSDAVYESLGFSAAFPLRRFTRAIKRNLWAQADFDTITAKKLPLLRKKYIQEPFVEPEHDGYIQMITQFYQNGAISSENDGAYAVFYRTENELLVTELAAESELAAVQLLESAGDRYARDKATLILGAENLLFAGEGKRYAGGAIKTFGNCPDAQFAYLGIAGHWGF